MSFRLIIPGRDTFQTGQAANSANLLTQPVPSSRLAGLAAHDTADTATDDSISGLARLAANEVSDSNHEGQLDRRAVFSFKGAPYWLADQLSGFQPWTDEEIALFQRRQARIAWLGYGGRSEYLAEKLVHRDRAMDDRRLCLECSHAGPGWHCAKKAGFLLEQLLRCDHFKKSE